MPSEDSVTPLFLPPTVLVVDDELTPRSIVCRMVRGIGYPVRSARDGREALRYIRQHPGEIRLLLTDVVMPLMDGGELAERAREAEPGLRVVFLSGDPLGQDAELLGTYPEFPVLTKPVRFNRLYDLLVEQIGTVIRTHPRKRPPARHRELRRTEREE